MPTHDDSVPLTDCQQCGAKINPDFSDDPDGWFCDHCGIYFNNTLTACPICEAEVNGYEGFARQVDGHRWQHAAGSGLP